MINDRLEIVYHELFFRYLNKYIIYSIPFNFKILPDRLYYIVRFRYKYIWNIWNITLDK